MGGSKVYKDARSRHHAALVTMTWRSLGRMYAMNLFRILIVSKNNQSEEMRRSGELQVAFQRRAIQASSSSHWLSRVAFFSIQSLLSLRSQIGERSPLARKTHGEKCCSEVHMCMSVVCR